jgi:uncharacterized protein YdcH (DUF465 family)
MEKIRVDVNSASVEVVQLRERHGEIERRLAELERHLSLTSDEQIERARLKKEKLRTKDRIALLSADPSASSSRSSSTVPADSSPPPGRPTRLPAA